MSENKKCSFDPKTYAGQPIGMFHCPECGDMVLAGMEHPDYDNMTEKYQEYCDQKYEGLKNYLEKNLGQSIYHTFHIFMETMPTVKHVMMEIWLRCDINEDHKCMHCNIDVADPFAYCSEACAKAQEFEMAQQPTL